jgi:hypothetical protein
LCAARWSSPNPPPLSADNRARGNGSGPTTEPNRFGILWFMAPRQPLSAWHVVFASRPASIRTYPSPQTRCQMGSLVLVGRCYLCDGLQWTKTRNAVCPIATVMLYFDASQCFHSSHAAIEFNSSYRISPSSSYAALARLLFRSGS